MKINKLKDEIFYDFASKKLGVNIKTLYPYDSIIRRDRNQIELSVDVGGESGDNRRFIFTDHQSVYTNGSFYSSKNISAEWVTYLISKENGLSDEDKRYIVEKYNASIENDIEEYSRKKRSKLINLEQDADLTL